MIGAYLITPLVLTFFSVLLMVVVLTANARSSTNRLFACFLIGLATWGVFIFAMRASPDLDHAYFWEQWFAPLGAINAVLLFHFTIRYTFREVRSWVLPLLYFVCLLILFLAPTGLALKSMQLKSYGYVPVLGPVWYFVIFFSYALTVMTMVVLVRSYRTAGDAEHRNRIAYIFIGIIFMLVGGVFDILPMMGLTLYPGLIVGNIAFCMLTTVAIVKHRLLDIRVIMRRSLAYFMTSAIISIPFLVIFLLATTALIELEFGIWTFLLLLLLLALVVPSIWRWAQERIDRWFYGGRYGFMKALEFFGSTHSFAESGRLASTMCDLLAGALRAQGVYLLLPESDTGDFKCIASAGGKKSASDISLNSRSALLRWLKHTDAVLPYGDIDMIPQLRSMSPSEREVLNGVSASLIMPMKTRTGRLSGVLILSPKLSGLPYYVEDQQLLVGLSNQVATHMDNLRLYEETRQSEKALRESEEKLRRMFESMTEGIIISDPQWVITEVNSPAIHMHGYSSKDELIGQSVFRLIAEKDRTRTTQSLKEAVQEGVRLIECALLKGDDTEFPAELSSAVLRDASGAITGYVLVTEDVTERKQMEISRKEYELRAHAASRLATVGEMAAGIAHEINNPLTGVVGFSQLLIKKDIPENIKKDVEIIYDGAQRVASIVARLLTFARQQKPERRHVNINDILRTTLDLRAYYMKAHNIDIATEFDPELPTTLADAGQLQQVFLNLILNAETEMKLAHGKGKLLVKTETENGIIRTSFSDDGPGIPEENMKRLFEPFFTTREVGQGTGLGLSICYGIVTEHGGKIYARSKLGEGATFNVELPIISINEAPGAVQPQPAESEKAASSRILVVDDEPMVQRYLVRILTDDGHTVDTVDNASDALTKLKSNDYRLIILDIKLPGMTGIELYNRIKKETPSLTEKIVVITGDVMGEDTQNFLSANKATYIVKPFNFEQLQKTLSRALG